MPEPISTATTTLVAAAATVPVLTAFGVPLGLRADILVAGFSGSLAAIALLNLVPGDSDTWPSMARTALRRMAVAAASSLTAGYLTPLSLLLANVPGEVLLSGAFAVGAGAQQVLMFAIRRLSGASAGGPERADGGTP